MLALARRLHEAGVLGINRRNADYILVHNQRRLYPLVDDKALTKQIAMEKGIAVPALYGMVEIQAQVATIPEIIAGHDDFVLKPAQGSQGQGIVVVTGRSKGY
jgi:glutathione synthase/RimK-type ligase-like ATP-grasp enzyme